MPGAKLWLTYAWKDNADQDVDFVIQELQAAGLDVGFDRAKLLAGQRLWDQIARHISDVDLDAWAILVTRNSLQSEPCQEELAYALDRSLRTKGSQFPLIGIFPERIEHELIPSALATRLYVTLADPKWAKQVASAVKRDPATYEPSAVEPFGYKWHQFQGKPVLEVWPRIGQWTPFWAGVPVQEGAKLDHIMSGPRSFITGTGETASVTCSIPGYKTLGMMQEVSNSTSAHIFLLEIPSEVIFGGMCKGEQKTYKLQNLY